MFSSRFTIRRPFAVRRSRCKQFQRRPFAKDRFRNGGKRDVLGRTIRRKRIARRERMDEVVEPPLRARVAQRDVVRPIVASDHLVPGPEYQGQNKRVDADDPHVTEEMRTTSWPNTMNGGPDDTRSHGSTSCR